MVQGVYIISSRRGGVRYIGSAVDMDKRLSSHKLDYRKWVAGAPTAACSSVEVLCFDDWELEVVEVVVDASQLRIREQAWMDTCETVNKVRAHGLDKERKKATKKAYDEDNKEEKKAYMKTYRKTYYKDNKEKIAAQSKEQYEANKEERAVYNKVRYEETLGVKTTCPVCGAEVAKQHLKKHQKIRRCLAAKSSQKLF